MPHRCPIAKSDLFGPVVVPRRTGIINGGREMSSDVLPVSPPDVVDGSQSMQRRKSSVDEAAERVQFRRFSGQEVTVGGVPESMHGSPWGRQRSPMQSERHRQIASFAEYGDRG
jgi:hypothetical protein